MSTLTDELVIERLDSLSEQQAQAIIAIFPDDSLKTKRIANLSKAGYVLVAKHNEVVAGVFFVRTIFQIPNATWIVWQAYRRRGIALRLIKRAQDDFRLITAIARNSASASLARKGGFLVFPLGIGIWMRGMGHE